MVARLAALAGLAGLALLAATPARAQRPTMGVGAEYRGLSFEDGLGADAAQLLLTPMALRLPVSRSLVLDLYAAWAQGRVEREGVAYTLDGPVDTRLKASWQATPWALLSLGVTAPTGHATHDDQEARVASVLSSDLLGFQETTWGSGAALTSAVATAGRLGGFGVGVAASYAVRGGFEPDAGRDLTYRPGDETRLRLGFDRNLGTGTVTGGLTFTRYDRDRAGGRNLFQAGDRLRADLAWAFRAGAGVWTVWAADVWRENGDLTLDVVDPAGAPLGDSTLATPSQNLVTAGVEGTVGLGGAWILKPRLDLRLQRREEPDGRREGSGWLLAAGGDLPVRLFGGYDVFPRALLLVGSVEGGDGVGRRVLGAEVSATVRWSF